MAAGPGPKTTTSNYRTLLHEYFQKEGIHPRFNFIEDYTCRVPSFKCTIQFTLDGKTIREESETFSRKDHAKENAAYKVMSNMTQSRGRIASPPTNSANITYKMKLKQYYDKQGQPWKELDYKTEPDSRGSFVSHIYIPELQKEVKGESARTKKEAEQNTAKKVLQLLQYH